MKIRQLEPSKQLCFLQEYIQIFKIISRGPPTKNLSNPMSVKLVIIDLMII